MTQYDIGMGQALGTSLLGFAIVFLVLASLIVMIKLISRFGGKPEPVAATAGATAAPVTASAPVTPVASSGIPAGKVKAKGSFGDVDLHTVDDRTAAILMAIVANEMNAPLGELRFISIREIEG